MFLTLASSGRFPSWRKEAAHICRWSRVAMMKINQPSARVATARSAQRGVPRRATSAVWFLGLPVHSRDACRRHGLAARASIRQSRQTELCRSPELRFVRR
jgi:hypothetical protein